MTKSIFTCIIAIGILISGVFVYKNHTVLPKSKIGVVTKHESNLGGKSPTTLGGEKSNAIPPKSPYEIPLTYEYLRIANLDSDTAGKLLERCEKEIPDLDKRSIICQAIIGSLCRQGLVSDAWSLVSPNPGSLRAGEIHSFFLHSGSTNLNDISKYLAQLESPQDRRVATDSLLQVRPEAILQMDPSEIFGTTAEEQMGIVGGLSTALQSKRNPEIEGALIDRLFQLTASGKLNPVGLINILQNSTTIDSFASWEMLKTHIKSFDPKSLEKVQSSLARNMMNRNPDQTMSVLCSDPSTKYSYPILSSAIQKFYDVSQNDANNWITSNIDKLDPATSQRIISVVAQQANRNNEFETSRKWANRILNVEVRGQLLEQVDKREAEKAKQPTK